MIKEIRLFTENGNVFATSRQIAKNFEKEHKHILEKINSIIAEIEPAEKSTRWFLLSEYKDSKGEMRKEYKLTRDGFSLLAMGFTGSKAMKFKIDYIAKFNLIEQQLRDIETTMNSKGILSEEDYAEIKFSTAQRVGTTFTDSQDIQKVYDRFTTYSRKSMDVPKRITRLNQILDALQNREDNLYIKKAKGYKSERENIIEIREQILKDINEINNRSYGQKLGHALKKTS